MKKIVFFLFFLTAFFSSFQLTYAVEENGTTSADISPTPTSEYTLPYPGLLPDNWLYVLKTIRDRIIGFLISDPVKKLDFNLLAADKRLSAGMYLFEKRKFSLAESAISKGENYFEDAIEKAEEAKQQGLEVKSILQKLSFAAYKHKAVLQDMEKKAPKEVKVNFTNLIIRVEGHKKRVASTLSK